MLGVFLGALPLGLLGWPLGALLCPTLDDTSALQRLLHHRHDFGLPLGALLGLLKQSKKNVLLLIVTKSCAAVRPWAVSFFNVFGTFFKSFPKMLPDVFVKFYLILGYTEFARKLHHKVPCPV